MADLKLQDLTLMFQGLGGALTSLRGSQIAADAYRASGEGAVAAAQYNADLVKLQTNRQLDDLARRIIATSGAQRAQAGTSGVAVSSKSSLAVMHATITQFQREADRLRVSGQIGQQQQIFQGEVARVQAENQARAAERQGRSSFLSRIPDLLSFIGDDK